MTPVDQNIICSGRGDCQRAVVASLLDIEIEQVPHFKLFGDGEWFKVFNAFLWSLGWQYEGCHTTTKTRGLLLEDSINGYFEASVPSRTFEGATHAVIIDIDGVVVHDPNPNKKWQGVNVLESGDLLNWYIFSPVER